MDEELRQRLESIEAAVNTILDLLTTDDSEDDALVDLDGNEYGAEREQVSLS